MQQLAVQAEDAAIATVVLMRPRPIVSCRACSP